MIIPFTSTRRAILGSALATALGGAPASAQAARRASPLDPALSGLRPSSPQDQSTVLQRAIATAANERRALVLPPGRYHAEGLVLPPGTRLLGAGVGATTLVQAGPRPLLTARDGERLALAELSLEGGAGAAGSALVSLSGIERLDIANVGFVKAGGIALRAERCGGRIEGNEIVGADVGIFSLDATGLQIVRNSVEQCANNGIQVWRSQKGYDGTQVLANRVRQVRADAGGSGQNGNGINVFRAGGVIVAENVIRACAFSAVRNNSGDAVQIVANSCTELGEVAIYSEFSFEGAIITGNLVDRANVGVSITNFNEGGRLAVASGNIVRNISRRFNPTKGALDGGTGIAVEADAAVTGNVVEDAEFAGISLGYGTYLRDVLCATNVVRRCAYGIAASVVPGSGAAQIRDNILSECSRGRIVGFNYDDPASPDLFDGRDTRFPHLAIGGNTGQ